MSGLKKQIAARGKHGFVVNPARHQEVR